MSDTGYLIRLVPKFGLQPMVTLAYALDELEARGFALPDDPKLWKSLAKAGKAAQVLLDLMEPPK